MYQYCINNIHFATLLICPFVFLIIHFPGLHFSVNCLCHIKMAVNSIYFILYREYTTFLFQMQHEFF